MRKLILAGLVVSALAPAAAGAQTNPTTFRGFRVEGNIGYDRFKAQGDRNGKLGYGGTIGFDGTIGDRIVIGAEGSYWHPDKNNTTCGAFNGGTICQISLHEYGAAIRAGYLVTPRVLVFGKGGYVHDRQVNSFSGPGLYYVDGNIVGPGYSFANHNSADGYQAGGGVEFSLTDMFYVNGQFVYSRYSNNTSRERAMMGVGLRFK